jgi:RNA polymerase sigma factor (sigma-70 family)
MQASFFEKAIEAQFDCLTKIAIKSERSKYYTHISKYWRNEVLISNLSQIKLEEFADVENYPSDYMVFNVFGMEVEIMDEKLSEALEMLPEKKRDIILLSYFLDMSDFEIGKLMNLVRSTIYRHRTSILKELKKVYKEEAKYE